MQIRIILLSLCGMLAQLGLAQPVATPISYWPGLRDFARQQSGMAGKIAEHHDHPHTCTEFDWNGSGSVWDSTYRTTFAYFPDGRVAEEITARFLANQFQPNSRLTNLFNAHGDRINTTSYEWDSAAWVNSFKHEITYDPYGNPLLFWDFDWVQGAWDTVAGNRITYTYTFTDKPTSGLDEVWLGTGLGWRNSSLEELTWPTPQGWDSYTYSRWLNNAWEPQDRQVAVSWYKFSEWMPYSITYQTYYNGAWLNEGKRDYTYGQYDSEVSFSQEWLNVAWDTLYKDVITRDSLSHAILEEGYDWVGTWQFSSGDQNDYAYDGQGHTVEIIHQSWTGNVYEFETKQVYDNFFTVNAASPTTILSQVTAFPNPCTDKLNFKLELQQNSPVQIALYDLQGRLRMQTASPRLMDSQVTVPISEVLENGTYVYRISTKEGVAEGKVIVQR
jgi:Secretion system C-terminal sorting domain